MKHILPFILALAACDPGSSGGKTTVNPTTTQDATTTDATETDEDATASTTEAPDTTNDVTTPQHEKSSCETQYDCMLYCIGEECDACVTSPEVQEHVDAVFQCQIVTCDHDWSCIWETCADATALCFFDTFGTQTCAQIDACADACDDDKTCIDTCTEQGTRAAQAAYISYRTCVDLDIGECDATYNGCFSPQ